MTTLILFPATLITILFALYVAYFTIFTEKFDEIIGENNNYSSRPRHEEDLTWMTPPTKKSIDPLRELTDKEREEFDRVFNIIWENPANIDMDSEEYRLAGAKYDELLEIGEKRQKMKWKKAWLKKELYNKNIGFTIIIYAVVMLQLSYSYIISPDAPYYEPIKTITATVGLILILIYFVIRSRIVKGLKEAEGISMK